MTSPVFSAQIDPWAKQVCSILQSFDHRAYLVGGCVRDLFLGQTPTDWDIATGASPTEVTSLFDKVIPTGLKHGTITVCLGPELQHHFEVTTFRIEGIYLDGRRPENVQFVQRIEEDLSRRDLTINAMAYDPIDNRLIDPFGGLQDLNNQIIRTVGQAKDRFQEDGLRIMRAARFAARLGYQMDPATLQGMQDSLDTLKLVSRERVKDELWKILATPLPSIGLQILRKCGALVQIEPEWGRPAILDGMVNVDLIPGAEIETKLTVLCATFASFTLDNLSQRLKLSRLESKKTAFLLKALDQFAIYLREQTAHQFRIFKAFLINQSPAPNSEKEFLLFSDAIGLDARQDFEQYAQEIVWPRTKLAIDGNDLLALGVSSGPQIKTLLDKCYQEILRQPSHNTREFLLAHFSK